MRKLNESSSGNTKSKNSEIKKRRKIKDEGEFNLADMNSDRQNDN
jgi:hypothetical protein